MEIFIDIVAVILGIVGLLGCILPVLPGPPCSLAGMFLLVLPVPRTILHGGC